MNSKSIIHFLFFFLLAFIITPALSQEEASKETSVSVETNNRTHRWKTSTGVTNFNVEYRGKIEVTDDDKDIKSMSDDGYLEISKTVFGSKRSIVIESLGGGKLSKSYWEGRSKSEWNPNGQQWLGEILPEIVRSTSLAAEGRVNRFFRQGGVQAVLNEIDQLKSDYVRAQYAKLLLEKDIPEKELPNLITSISNAISSDYYLSVVLKDNIGKLLTTREAADAFFKGTSKIGSDYYKSVVLKESLKKYAASPNQVNTILQSAGTINSDYYLSVVLITLLEQSNVKEESLSELVIVSKKIPSDYYRTQVLNKALQKQNVSKTTIKNMVDALADVNSDYYKHTVFNSLAEREQLEPDVQLQVVKIIGNSINSDYYASVSLRKVLAHQQLTDESFQELVSAAGHMGSSSYGSNVLEEAAKKDLSKKQLLSILKASENINSDHYRTEVLTRLAPKVRNSDADVKDAYRQAAKGIGSETYYGRAMRAIE